MSPLPAGKVERLSRRDVNHPSSQQQLKLEVGGVELKKNPFFSFIAAWICSLTHQIDRNGVAAIVTTIFAGGFPQGEAWG